ncbi:MAG: SrfA family protein [Desulfovibrionaceae bacterium]|nr:SrfA family protein [Desulfovibrionaceae bacterium]
MSILFATSRRSAMRPMSCQGVLAAECHVQLRAFLVQHRQFLAERGMTNAASFLAEPERDRTTIDWYAEGSERPVPLASLPEDGQALIRAKLETCLQALRALAASQQSASPLAAGLLVQALHHPSEADVHVLDGEPVLINWGYAGGVGNAAPENIMRVGSGDIAAPVRPARPEPAGSAVPSPAFAAMAAAPAAASFAGEPKAAPVVPPAVPPVVPPVPPAEEPAPEPQSGPEDPLEPSARQDGPFARPYAPLFAAASQTPPQDSVPPASEPQAQEGAPAGVRVVPLPVPAAGCLSWLLPLLLLALLIWLLLAALGLAPSPLPAGCFRQAVTLDSERARAQSLALSEQELSRQVQEHAALCVPPRQEPQEEPREEPLPEKPLAQAEPPAALPDFGTPVIIPEEPKPEPPKTRKGDALNIPKAAEKERDLSFLEGCWESSTGLVNREKQFDIKVEYCFDKKGRGKRHVHEVGASGQKCTGTARARFSGGRLYIEDHGASCPRGGGYNSGTVVCTGSGSSTTCRGRQPGAKDWKADFRRK